MRFSVHTGFFLGIILYLMRWFPAEERAAAITVLMIGNLISVIFWCLGLDRHPEDGQMLIFAPINATSAIMPLSDNFKSSASKLG
jgi:hypothetical protein